MPLRKIGNHAPFAGYLHSVVRFGGEEFVVVLPETAREGAMRTGEKLRETVSLHPFLNHNVGLFEPLSLTISLGLASYPEDGLTTDDLIRKADNSLYRAKRNGKNRVVN